MRSLFILFLIGGLFPVSLAASSANEYNPVELVTAGGFSVYKYKVEDQSLEGFLARTAINNPSRKVLVRVSDYNLSNGFSRASLSNYIKQNPAYDEIGHIVFSYLTNAYQRWREAANANLPAKYQLPEIEFVYENIYSVASGKTPSVARQSQTPIILLRLVIDEYGIYDRKDGSIARAKAIPYFRQDGTGEGYITFTVQQQWMDYLNAKYTHAVDLQTASNTYAKAIAGVLTGSYDVSDEPGWIETDQSRTLREKKNKMMSSFNPQVESWHVKGPWARFNQGVMTHELGHLFLLPHEKVSSSIMYPTVSGRSSGKVSKKDGLHLAALVCWYHNQLAGREVCKPEVDSYRAEMEKNRLELSNSLQKARKNIESQAGILRNQTPNAKLATR